MIIIYNTKTSLSIHSILAFRSLILPRELEQITILIPPKIWIFVLIMYYECDVVSTPKPYIMTYISN